MMKPTKKELTQMLSLIRGCAGIMLPAHGVSGESGDITQKAGDANFVTAYDVRVQETLISGLKEIYPDAAFFAEEQNNTDDVFGAEHCFVIDPIDGTTNFIHDMKCSAVSVAMLCRGRTVFGAVYDPYLDELFSAVEGGGAFVNGRAIHVAARPMEQSLVCFGTSPYEKAKYGDATFRQVKEIFMRCADIRRSGSAALDVCYVASGRTDIYFENVLSPWDFAAGSLILTEAGGVWSDFCGNTPRPGQKTSFVCANHALHRQVLGLFDK